MQNVIDELREYIKDLQERIYIAENTEEEDVFELYDLYEEADRQLTFLIGWETQGVLNVLK